MLKLKRFILFCSLVSVTSANAELTIKSPQSVCALLASQGLATLPWTHQYDNIFGCNSPYKNIGTGFPLANNLAYYVDGSKTFVTQAKLVLNINNKSQAASAYTALLKSSEALSLKLAGTKLPPTIVAAIKSGKPTKIVIAKTTIEVSRDNWPTGNGYELHVVFN